MVKLWEVVSKAADYDICEICGEAQEIPGAAIEDYHTEKESDIILEGLN